MNRTINRKFIMLTALLMAAIGLSACSATKTATTSAQCGWIVGNGEDGNDLNVHEVKYPGQKVELGNGVGTTEELKTIPCNPRNWIVNPKGSVDANGDPIGDYHEAMQGVTSGGTRVNVWLSMYWTPNQSESVMRDQFFPFCDKYDCFSNDSAKVNNSSAGWNDMLGENLPGAVNASVRQAMTAYDDDVWEKDANWEKLAEAISASFSANFSVTSGYGNDLFCGSGDVSGWSDPTKPGEGEFTCGTVRFAIDDVVNSDAAQQKIAEQTSQVERQKKANADKLAIAKELYGDKASETIASLDIIAACKAAGATCVVSIGSSSSPTVVTPPASKQ